MSDLLMELVDSYAVMPKLWTSGENSWEQQSLPEMLRCPPPAERKRIVYERINHRGNIRNFLEAPGGSIPHPKGIGSLTA